MRPEKRLIRFLLAKDLQGDLASELIALARANRVVMQRVPVERINRITRKNHQGVLAMMSAITYHRLDHLVPELYEAGILPFIVILDGITDVRNFGAIARTCECAGVDAIVIPARGGVGGQCRCGKDVGRRAPLPSGVPRALDIECCQISER